MKTIEKEVKLRGQVVDVAKVQQCENQEDLDSLGLGWVIDKVNRQTVTDVCNAVRAAHREKKPGSKKRLSQLLNILPKVRFADGSTGWDKLNECSMLETEEERQAAVEKLLASGEVTAALAST